MITIEQFVQLFPRAKGPDQWVASFNTLAPKFGVTSQRAVAAFLAQCGHESGGFTRLVENLNYSAQGLVSTWPTRFTPKNAGIYARQPEKIANAVYANRLGNGNEASGDGWRFRGAGVIQLTGRASHKAFADAIGKPLSEATEYLHTIRGGLEGAFWFWSVNKLNALAEAGDIKGLTKRINGGYLGLTERVALYNKILRILS